MPGGLPREAVSIPGGGQGQATLVLPPDAVYYVETVSFICDLSGSGASADVWVRFLTATNVVIAGAMVGSAQAAASVVTYALAPFANPCDAGASTALTITPDVFAGITLVDGCQVVIDARNVTTGAVNTAAQIKSAQLWVGIETAAAGADEIPLLTPIASGDQLAA